MTKILIITGLAFLFLLFVSGLGAAAKSVNEVLALNDTILVNEDLQTYPYLSQYGGDYISKIQTVEKYGAAFTEYRLCNPDYSQLDFSNISLNSLDKYFNEVTGELKASWITRKYDIIINDTQPVYLIEYVNITENNTSFVYENRTKIGSIKNNITQTDWLSFPNFNEIQLNKGYCFDFKIEGEFTMVNGSALIDNIPEFLGINYTQYDWWEPSYANKFPANCSYMDNGKPYMINGSSGFMVDGVQQLIIGYCSGVGTAAYFNDITDIVWANDSQQLPSFCHTCNSSSYNLDNLYSSDYKIVLPFNSSADDISGQNNDGTETGGSYTDLGFFGTGYNFSNDAGIIVNDHASLTFGTSHTFTAWIKTPSPPALGRFWDKEGGASGYTAYISANGKITTEEDIGGGWEGGATTGNYSGDTWYYLTVWWDGTDLRTYINGVLDRTETASGVMRDSVTDLRYGYYSSGHLLTGYMDEIAFTTTAWTEDQINQSYLSAFATSGYGDLLAMETQSGAVLENVNITNQPIYYNKTAECQFNVIKDVSNFTVYYNFTVDSSLLNSGNATYNYSVVSYFNSTQNYSPGQNLTCNIYVWDNSNVTTTSQSSSILIANYNPTVYLISPANDSYLAGTNANLTANFTVNDPDHDNNTCYLYAPGGNTSGNFTADNSSNLLSLIVSSDGSWNITCNDGTNTSISSTRSYSRTQIDLAYVSIASNKSEFNFTLYNSTNSYTSSFYNHTSTTAYLYLAPIGNYNLTVEGLSFGDYNFTYNLTALIGSIVDLRTLDINTTDNDTEADVSANCYEGNNFLKEQRKVYIDSDTRTASIYCNATWYFQDTKTQALSGNPEVMPFSMDPIWVNITAVDTNSTNIVNFTVAITGAYTNTTNATNSLYMPLPYNTSYNVTVSSSSYSTTTVTYTTNGSTQLEIELVLGNSATFNFKDENTNILLDNISISFELIVGDFESSSSYNITTGTIFISGLGNATNQSYTARYSSPGYTERLYHFTLTNNTGTVVTLYMLNSSLATNVTATVYDQYNNLIGGVIIKSLKYNPSLTSYIQVETAKTNFEGKTLLDVELGLEFYYFILEYNSMIVLTTTPTYIYETSINFQVILGDQVAQNFINSRGVNHNLTFNDVTNNFRYIYSDLNNVVQSGCLYVYRVTALGETLLNSTCVNSSAAMVLIEVANVSGRVYKGTGYVDFGSGDYFMDQYIKEFPTDNPMGSLGLLMALFLEIIFAGMFVWNRSIGAIMMPLGLLFCKMMSLITLEYTYIIPLVFLGIVLAIVFEIKKR